MRSCLFSLLLLLGLSPDSAEARVFVSLAGSLLEAEIESVAGDSVTLKRASDGLPLTIKQNTLCKEDIAYIARWVAASAAPGAPAPAVTPAATPPAAPGAVPEKYKLEVLAQPARSNQAPAGSSQTLLEVSYTFIVSNKEVSRNLEGAKAVIFTLGRNAARASEVVVLQKLEMDLAVRAQAKTELVTPAMQLISYQEPRSGVRTLGYVFFVLDAQGNVLLADSSPEGTLKDFALLSALTPIPCLVDREFRPRPGMEALEGYLRF